MLDLAMPEAHQTWCTDRFLPRSKDHASTAGNSTCTSAEVNIDPSDYASYAYVGEDGKGGIEVWVNEKCYPLAEVVSHPGRFPAPVSVLLAATGVA